MDALAALVVALIPLILHAVRGFPSLANSGGDNDSVLRLVQVRDLLGGQGWFDMTQYRMGLEGGFPMHWSRLVDAPLALLVALFGETAALVIWPTALFALSLFLIIRATRQIGGAAAQLPAAALGGLALHFINVFRPGAIDHHNVQLTLTLATLLFLIGARRSGPAGWLAGTCAGLMLAVGMETAPYVAVACAIAALCFLSGGEANVRLARNYGAGFAISSALALAVTSPMRDRFAVHCDALSFPQTSLALLGGGGLCLIALTPVLRATSFRRFVALGALGFLAAVAILSAFPQCVAAPYASLDPRLQSFLIDNISEAQSLLSTLRGAPAMLAVYYGTPVLAIILIGLTFARQGWNRDRALTAAFLAAAVLVAFWQLRGATFAIPLAVIPLAAWVAVVRRRAEKARGLVPQLALAGAWLVSANLFWQLGAMALSSATAEAASDDEEAAKCYAKTDYAPLAALPPGTVVGITNMGSSVLAYTPHRALAGPYHRNAGGIDAMLDVMMAAPDEAKAVVQRAQASIVAVCPGNPETSFIAEWAPNGLLAGLLKGKAPDWLERVESTADQPIVIYTLRGS
ncbi:GtrA family protein [Pseudaminobacter sp. 19-2017]|uniref:GtrA family protein n=1 Tax=Pseudaminobacter soli (ex Zhang et al. 2022) TaxID=2831468 RepID=A0A942DXC9_9HYPH|nr:GtrA family protein [Pseudaminobacter soli]MBS3649033.1 GtrA family protein [Pseudaminobacter soli]